jgi:predicted Zn-dependent protease
MVYLETANTFAPDSIDILIPLSEGYLKTNRTKEAIVLLKKAKAKKPDDIDVRQKLYHAYMQVGEKKTAMEEIKELLGRNRDNKLLLLYAEMSFEEGKIKETENALEDIKATDPENIEALMLQGKIQRSKKKYDEAIETYKEIIFIDANHVGALYERAETYMQQSKPQWAERFYDRALRADPSFGLAELGMARIAKLRKDDAAYISHLKNARKIDPQNKTIAEECKKAGL